MKFGLHLPQFEDFGDAQVLADLARDAEQAGWDGFFIWDHVLFDDLWHPMVDPWVALTAIAMQTEQMRIGTIITPMPRRRPWQLARETMSVDRLSGGRLTLGVGLGAPEEWEYGFFGEEVDARIRAEKLDEGLDILNGLWSGLPFGYEGKHYQLREMNFQPTPIQEPRIPIWVGGYWPTKAPFRRAARFDGVVPGGLNGPLSPDDWRDILAYIRHHRTNDEPFDAVAGGVTSGDEPERAAQIVEAYAAVGATWWLEDISPYGRGLEWSARTWPSELTDQLIERICQGPPTL